MSDCCAEKERAAVAALNLDTTPPRVRGIKEVLPKIYRASVGASSYES
jgi:hypothetical protein